MQITNLISVMYSASSIDGLPCLSMLFPFTLCLRNGRGFHTLQGLKVRVLGGQGGGSIVWTLVLLYSYSRVRVIVLAS